VIGYLDTSAFVPLIIAEPSSAACQRFWDDSDAVVTSRLIYVETAAALAQAHRLGRITTRSHRAGLRALDTLWAELDVVEVDEPLIVEAAGLADRHQLRGYDAVHCAAVLQLADDDLVAAAGDRELLRAWSLIGAATYDTNQP
jgi:predicted nucleic acid-binding protein